MSANLLLGLLAILVGATTLTVRFVLPVPPKTQDPYAHLARRGLFMPIAIGLVPLLAGLAFLGAWWQERDRWEPPPAAWEAPASSTAEVALPEADAPPAAAPPTTEAPPTPASVPPAGD